MRRYIFLSALLLAASSSSGCRHSCSCYRPPPAPPAIDRCDQYPVYGVLPPHPLTPQASAPVGVAAPFPPAAPAPAAVLAPPEPAAAPPVQANAPRQDSWYPPSQDGVRLSPPTTGPSQPSTPATAPSQPPPTTRLFPPSTPEPPLADRTTTAPQSAKAAVSEDQSATPPLPVGIAGFAVAADGVTSGMKPLLEGLDWLKAKGYRTVLHLKQPGESDSADQAVIESRGLKYLSLAVSPETLSRQHVDAFQRIVSDKANHPLFVYDRDGSLAGPLWYLKFRLAERESDEVARLRAARLGLSENATGNQQTMWVAVQKLLSQPNNR